MMDIVERINWVTPKDPDVRTEKDELLARAADEIERLRARVKELEKVAPAPTENDQRKPFRGLGSPAWGS